MEVAHTLDARMSLMKPRWHTSPLMLSWKPSAI